MAGRHLQVARIDHLLELVLQVFEELAALLSLLHGALGLLELRLLLIGNRLRLGQAESALEMLICCSSAAARC